MRNRVKSIIAYGDAGPKIKKQLHAEFSLIHCEQFEEAIRQAYEQSRPGDTVLLSPACASFDQFANYAERGDTFTKIFTKLELTL